MSLFDLIGAVCFTCCLLAILMVWAILPFMPGPIFLHIFVGLILLPVTLITGLMAWAMWSIFLGK